MTRDLEITGIELTCEDGALPRLASVSGDGFTFTVDQVHFMLLTGQCGFFVWHLGKYVDVEAFVHGVAGDVAPPQPWLCTMPDGVPLERIAHLSAEEEPTLA